MIFRSANLIGLQRSRKPDAEQEVSQKKQTAEFYAAQILPNTKSLKRKIIDGSKVIEQIDSRVFL